jgi:AAA domain, putative AbiEii toxin, Type IV TA system
MGIGVFLGAVDDEIATARYSLEIAPTGYDRSSYHVAREQCVIEGRDSRREWFERDRGGPFRSSAGDLRPQLTDEALVLPLVGGDSRFALVFRALEGIRAYAIDPHRVGEWQPPDSGRTLHGNGDNAANVLQGIKDNNPDDLRRICEIVGSIVPAIERIDVKEYGNKLGLEFTQRWDDGPISLTPDASSMSDGTLRALGLLAAVYQRQTPSLIAIEEPEATIHPGAIGVILDVLRHAAERTQVVVTTHSPEVLDAEWLEDRHIRVVNWQGGSTRVTPLDAGSREALRQHLMTAGELLRSNAMQGTPPGPDAAYRAGLFEEEPCDHSPASDRREPSIRLRSAGAPASIQAMASSSGIQGLTQQIDRSSGNRDRWS